MDLRQDILQTLIQASSQNTSILKCAEDKLKTYENVPGFYSVLMEVVMDQNQDLNARWQAVIYFKNGVDRYWRKNAPGALSEPEKESLRIKLMYCFKEPINQIATQLAVVIAKVARLDYPHMWPSLFPTLLDSIKLNDTLDEQRGLLVLNHVVKSLSSKRLAGDRRLFQELSGNIFAVILGIWKRLSEQFVVEASQQNNNCLNSLHKSQLAFKILRKLIVHGFKEPHQSPDVINCVSIIFDRLKFLIDMRFELIKSMQTAESQLVGQLEDYIVFHVKLLVDFLDNHPFSFIPFIQLSLEFTVLYIMRCQTEGMIFEKLLIQSLILLKGLIMCVEYKCSKAKNEAQHPGSLQAYEIKQSFFTDSTLSEICHRLVYCYFLFTKEDLRTWDDDPECFALEDKDESWKYNLRMCTECLFLAVFNEYRSVLIPVLLEMMRKNESLEHLQEFSDILKREAVYNAVGLTAFYLFDEVDFDNWFKSSLIKESQRKDSLYRVVRKRVVWMIGQWVAVKLSADLRPLLYETVLPLLRGDEDLVVRITAAETLKIAVDDFEFNSEQFLPYLQLSFGLLFQLLKDVSGSDTKMHVLNVLSFIVERMGPAIRPHAASLVDYLPLLWDESADHNMLRCAILCNLQHLVEGLGVLSENLHHFLVPVLNLSTDVKQEPHVYLLEDGLELWSVTLENASAINEPIFLLFNNVLPLLEYSSESLRTCFHIIQAYILLAPQQFKQSFLPRVMELCKEMVPEFRSEGIVLIMRLLESVLKVYGSEGAVLVQPVLPFILKALIQGEDFPLLLSMYLSVLAKVIFCNCYVFTTQLAQLALDTRRTPEQLFHSLLNFWCEKLPLVTHLERRKSLGLALATMFTAYTELIGDHFCGIVLGVVEVVNDILRSEDNEAPRVDSLLLDEGDLVYEENEKEHSRRKKQLSLKDPVHSVDLLRYTKAQLNSLKGVVGQKGFTDLTETLDLETKQQMQDLLALV